MKATVCQLPDPSGGDGALREAWEGLARHVARGGSGLVLLPEMPFHPWVARERGLSDAAWTDAVSGHDRWLERLPELGAGAVAGTRPVLREGRRLNEAFLWEPDGGYRAVHQKRYLPDEPGFWEASCYERGPEDFRAATVGGARVGFLVCTELWFPWHGREYGREGIHLLLAPRATPACSTGKWLAGGRAAAVVAGAFCLSSNRGPGPGGGVEGGAGGAGGEERQAAGGGPVRDADGGDDPGWAGGGWVVDPDGAVLGVTSREEPFLTLELEPEAAEAAKETYPRYVAS